MFREKLDRIENCLLELETQVLCTQTNCMDTPLLPEVPPMFCVT